MFESRKKMIKFKKGELTNLESRNPVKMLITDTRVVGRNTKALVAGVSERASRHPDAMASVFHTMASFPSWFYKINTIQLMCDFC